MGMGARNNKYNITTTTTQKKKEREKATQCCKIDQPPPPPVKRERKKKNTLMINHVHHTAKMQIDQEWTWERNNSESSNAKNTGEKMSSTCFLLFAPSSSMPSI